MIGKLFMFQSHVTVSLLCSYTTEWFNWLLDLTCINPLERDIYI